MTELESTITKMEEEKTASSARATELAALQDKSIVSGDLIKRVSYLVKHKLMWAKTSYVMCTEQLFSIVLVVIFHNNFCLELLFECLNNIKTI